MVRSMRSERLGCFPSTAKCARSCSWRTQTTTLPDRTSPPSSTTTRFPATAGRASACSTEASSARRATRTPSWSCCCRRRRRHHHASSGSASDPQMPTQTVPPPHSDRATTKTQNRVCDRTRTALSTPLSYAALLPDLFHYSCGMSSAATPALVDQ